MKSRYSIGIDLGTTNSALAFVDCGTVQPSSVVLPVDQLERPGFIKAEPILPSLLYLASPAERNGQLNIELQQDRRPAALAVGIYARERAPSVPGRVIHSAKSWLCHSAVDRLSRILPWGSAEVEEGEKFSPVQASAEILRHLKDAWNNQPGRIEQERFEQQQVCITVPASFDEAAQRLTLEAAQLAGFPDNLRLLEEPQAAFYYWLEQHAGQQDLLRLMPAAEKEKRIVLVIDVGGGTTDLSLFEVLCRPEQDLPEITRIAVSDHLLLGGDNMDLALAHLLEPRLVQQGRLSRNQWSQLVFQCRAIKEKALSGELGAEQTLHVSVTGSGSSLMAGARTAALKAAEIENLLLEGFFPLVSAGDRPAVTTAGLKEWGLPYAADSAITRHLAAFLAGRTVHGILCNGGALKPLFLQRRIADLIASWQPDRAPVLLPGADMDLAVAHGAAWYGQVIRGRQGRIKAGYPHSLYLKLGAEKPGEDSRMICLVPRGTQPGETIPLSGRKFSLLVNQPVSFELFHSLEREHDQAGAVVPQSASIFHALPPMQTRLAAARAKTREVHVEMEADLSETGLLQVFCVEAGPDASGGRWELQFNLRKEAGGAPQREAEDLDPGVSARRVEEVLQIIDYFYGRARPAEGARSPKGLAAELEKALARERGEWNTVLLRMLWPPLGRGLTKRGRSLAHELSWLYLAGYVLRPGFGADLDHFRIAEIWRAFELGLFFPKERSAITQWWIMWRRIAGGLAAQQQQQLFERYFPELRQSGEAAPELLRLLASLERVQKADRQEFCAYLLRQLQRNTGGREQMLWALGRTGSRVPFYGGPDSVLPPSDIEGWFAQLQQAEWRTAPMSQCIQLFSQACRRVNQRELDVSEDLRIRVLARMRQCGADRRFLDPVESFVRPDTSFNTVLFGEALPAGLRLAE